MTWLAARCQLARLITASADNAAARAAEAAHVPYSVRPDATPLLGNVDVPRVDLIVSAHSFRIIPPWALRRAVLGGIGYHPSLLPAFRGRSAVAGDRRHRLLANTGDRRRPSGARQRPPIAGRCSGRVR